MSIDPWSSAEPYEPFMGRWSRRLATEVVAWAEPPPRRRWVDVGCGTGAAIEALLDAADPESVLGIDPSEAYVSAARARLADPRVTVEVGGAASLPLDDESVDEAISGLVLNFVPDVDVALAELRRVLVPGGRVTAYVWNYASGMQMLRTFWDAAIALDPAVAGRDERFAVCEPGGLAAALVAAGFVVVQERAVEVPTVFHDFADYWTPFLGGQGPAPGYVAGLSEGAREQLRSRLEATLPQESDGSIHLRAQAWAVSARR